MAIVNLPINGSFESWGSQLYLNLPQYKIPIVPLVAHWRQWATMLVMDNLLDGKVPLPNKDSYPNDEDWRKWANFFVDSLNG